MRGRARWKTILSLTHQLFLEVRGIAGQRSIDADHPLPRFMLRARLQLAPAPAEQHAVLLSVQRVPLLNESATSKPYAC